MRRRLLITLSATVLALSMMAGSALAQPPPPPHDHFLEVPGTDEEVQVGPPRCRLGDRLDRAFLNFHFNVHVGAPTANGGLVIAAELC